jgi:uncharacterized protein with HEPN domain
MDKHKLKDRIEDILNSIRLIKLFMEGVDEAFFLKDLKIQSAVQFQFLIIGEAIRSIDEKLLSRYNYPWHIPVSFRNFIIHSYHGIKIERIYFATKDLDQLEKQVRAILENEF